MSHLVAVVGPTAVGKSQLALTLARSFKGEIVNADSRQLYRHMNIGTAKPTPEELALVPHHLINILNPDEHFSLAQYRKLAYETIEEIEGRQKLPILVGGTGLYVWTILENWQIPRVAPDTNFRKNLEDKARVQGTPALYGELLSVDPEAAAKIDPRNLRRIIRALEVYQSTRTPFSRLLNKSSPPFDSLIVGLTQERAKLYQRIDRRVEEMIAKGLVKEVENLMRMGYHLELPAMSAIGYRQIGMSLKDELTLDEAIRKIKIETHRYARQQYGWFRLADARINWFDVGEEPEAAIKTLVAGFLEKT
ncbi:MAG: tRNA (adenosine(37)-N6)-dimethylallyltransferase MiaA [Chloroflexota bacterium]